MVSMSGYSKFNNINSPEKYFLNINLLDSDSDNGKSKKQRKNEIYRK